MQKNWISLGLMSGTSGDGVDASIIRTNGINQYESIKDKYFEYDLDIYKDIHNLKEKIHKIEHLETYSNEINNLERKITIFHAEVIKKLSISDDTIIGFHGQTIYHNPDKKISIQLGNPQKLAKMLNRNVVSDFRNKDIQIGGQGAPLAPIYHQFMINNLNLKLPSCILNIGGVANLTFWDGKNLIGFDTGPGNALMDNFTKSISNNYYDEKIKKAYLFQKITTKVIR